MEIRPLEKHFWEGEIPVQNLYTAGIAGEKFLCALQERGELLATFCQKCNITYLPPHLYCQQCFDELTNWHTVGNWATVYSYTIEGDQIYALLDFPNVTTKFLHKLGGLKKEEVKIGMKVEAVFKEPQSRTGSILDILYFKRV